MSIDINILKSKGAICKHYDKNEVIFYEDESANYYYQIVEGAVKMFNANNEGKQFLQGLFGNGQSFGEPPLIIHGKYPSTAVVLKPSIICRLPKEDFLELVTTNLEMQYRLLEVFAQRLYSKAVTANEIINHNPESRILSFLDAYKKKCQSGDKAIIPFTRQVIADFTGLRVETVIRTLSKMKLDSKVDIVNRKVIY